MKSIKRTFAGVLFIIALSCSTVFAEGEMGGGGFASTEDPIQVSTTASDDGEMGGGGRSESRGGYIDVLLASIDAYFDSLV